MAHRILVGLIVLLTMFVVAERRMSDVPARQVPEPLPGLWQQAQHPERGLATSPTHGAPALNCSLVVSLDRNSRFTFTSPEAGVRFDIDADGDLDQVSWTEAGSDVAFLARDRDGNGTVTSGGELIGQHAFPGARNGANALIKLARDGGAVNRWGTAGSENPLFLELLLWTDANHNGISEAAELRSARDLVSDIGLGFAIIHMNDRHANESRYRGFVHVRTTQEPQPITTPEEDVRRSRPVYDVCLGTKRSI